MRRARLEVYIDVLKALAQKGPLKITHITHILNVNCSVLRTYLNFMLKQKLVEEKKISKKRVAYDITQRGITVLRHFGELQEVVPMLQKPREIRKVLTISRQPTNRRQPE